MKRVLFVHTANPHSELEHRFRPIWPAQLAAYAEKVFGTQTLEFRYMTGKLEDELAEYKPHVVGIGSVSKNFTYAKQFSETAKKAGCSVIMGGIHISCIPTCLTEYMDAGCIGEGEETFVDLMKHFLKFGEFNKEELHNINGIIYYQNGSLKHTPPRALAPSLDYLMHPKRSLIGYQSYEYLFTSRGCPYECIFCNSTRFWQKIRYASPEHVLEEIGELVDKGIKLIGFWDDLLIANKTRFRKIVDLVISHNYHKRATFSCACRANLVTEEIAELCKSMNMLNVTFGFESGNQRMLNYYKGKVKVEDNVNAVKIMTNAGITVHGGIIIGGPDETEEEVMDSYRFLKNNKVSYIEIYVLGPYPGTPIWDLALKRGLVSNDMDWNKLDHNFLTPKSEILLAEKLTRKQLTKLYNKLRRLRLLRKIQALPSSPRLKLLPVRVYRVIVERLFRLIGVR